MTEVKFHFNVADPVDYACRMVRRAAATGARVVVTGQAELLRELDEALWTRFPLEFIPHCHLGSAEPQVIAASPVVLADSPRAAPHHEVLVNVGGPVPEGFERYERLNELVSGDQADRQQARARWKHYADRGYAIQRHDAGAREAR
jgi:DNA polymerase-3 subunit chi